jgi:hypothetical protein
VFVVNKVDLLEGEKEVQQLLGGWLAWALRAAVIIVTSA